MAGLDDVLGGGLPPDRLYLVQGEPGVGKTTLALQFLLDGVRRGERALFITLSETEDELKAYLTDNSAEKIAGNLEQWSNAKGVRAAYKMLRAARYKCLLTLGKRLRGDPASA